MDTLRQSNGSGDQSKLVVKVIPSDFKVKLNDQCSLNACIFVIFVLDVSFLLIIVCSRI